MADPERIFPDEYVPREQASSAHRKWEQANPNGDAPKWRAFRDEVLAYKKGDSVAEPNMATPHGDALVAAGKLHMSVVDLGSVWPDPDPPPTGNELTWASPTEQGLMGSPSGAYPNGTPIVDFTLTNSTRTSSTLNSGQNRDLRINQTQAITGAITELGSCTSPWRHIEYIGGDITNSAGLFHGVIITHGRTGILHIEGVKFIAAREGDFIVERHGGTSSTTQIQNCYGEVTHFNVGYHADWYQTQEARVGTFRIDKCTICTDYQGILHNNEPFSGHANPAGPSQVFSSHFKRLNIRRHPDNRNLMAPWLFKAIPPLPPNDTNDQFVGPWTLEDVWENFPTPSTQAGPYNYPHATFRQWNGTAIRYGSYVTSTQLRWSGPGDIVPNLSGHPFANQPASDCQISGVVNLGTPPGGDFCPEDVPGINYVSPGYL